MSELDDAHRRVASVLREDMEKMATGADSESMTLAIGYWMLWGTWLSSTLAKRKEPKSSQEERLCRQQLKWTYEAAIDRLLRESLKLGIDADGLAKCKIVASDVILNPDRERYRCWDFPSQWPSMIGEDLFNMTETLQKAILEGSAAFDRLIAAGGLQEDVAMTANQASRADKWSPEFGAKVVALRKSMSIRAVAEELSKPCYNDLKPISKRGDDVYPSETTVKNILKEMRGHETDNLD